jgi:hypothetical protein
MRKKSTKYLSARGSLNLLILRQKPGGRQKAAAMVTYLGRAVDISRANLGVFLACFWLFICDPFEE